MSGLPEIVGRDEFAALVIRTDYEDEAAWRAVVAELERPWGDDGEFDAAVHLVDDRVWAGATPDQVREAVRRDEETCVVFLADGVTMRSALRPLLALDPVEEEILDPEFYRELLDLPREFRTVPAGVHCVHANLSLANMGFEEYAEAASAEADGVYRSF
ncbi:DUF6924 domain-containing protein [Streptomyces sp. NPDC048337]|uniref:DUF6924 domain-containing protein n=1 Tax=Streptomyces sp. NPDC048337 TaxID=3365535 RepID=UPI003715DFB1